jgi:hypothetical protein
MLRILASGPNWIWGKKPAFQTALNGDCTFTDNNVIVVHSFLLKCWLSSSCHGSVTTVWWFCKDFCFEMTWATTQRYRFTTNWRSLLDHKLNMNYKSLVILLNIWLHTDNQIKGSDVFKKKSSSLLGIENFKEHINSKFWKILISLLAKLHQLENAWYYKDL